VVSLENTKDLLAPDGILPHIFSQQRATKLLIEWVERNKLKPEKKVDVPRGLYLPIWTFDIGGVIDYIGEIIKIEDDSAESYHQQPVKRVSDQYPVLMDDLPVPASRKLSAVLLNLIPTFELKAVKPYDPRFLADWPAEVYDIPMAEASLDARSLVYSQYKNDLPNRLSGMRITHFSSAKLAVQSFKLVLLPVWISELPFDGREHLVLINGQNGIVASDIQDNSRKSVGLMEFLADLLED
jgi:hypothetical protein